MGSQNKKTYEITIVALFAAVTFLGIQVFRIPLPAAVGVPFLHFGNIFLLLGALLMGGKKGAWAGAMGFAIFDILNGYIMVMPKVVVIAILMSIVASKLFNTYKDQLGVSKAIILGTSVAFLISLTGDFLYDTATLFLAGSSLGPAMWAAFTSLLATLVNSVFGIIAVTLLYPVMNPLFKKTAYNDNK